MALALGAAALLVMGLTPGITMEPLAEQAGTGLEVSLKKIPIRQETVEICNELDVNPYELSGNGSLLFVTDQGEMLAEQLQQQKIPRRWIGFCRRTMIA